MFESLFWLVIGLAIGWNFPQPAWARELQARIQAYLRSR